MPGMETEQIWREIDAGRAALADLLVGLDDAQWGTASLCEGWSVRDVGAHLTQAHSGLSDVLWPLVRSGFSFNRTVHRLALDSPLDHAGIVAALRAMVGSRRRAVGVTPMEPLLDILVHTQDIAVPLGLDVPMPPEAAIAAAERTFAYRGPLRFTRRFDDVTFVATDVDWRHGTAEAEVRGPIAALVMALTGRPDPRVAGELGRLRG